MYAKKTSKAKVIAIALAVALLIGCGIGGTIAWLIDDTDTITNTFTTSKVDIELHEPNPTDKDDIKMVPGAVIPKNPYVAIVDGSEYCYIFVEITETNNFGNFMEYNVDPIWTPVTGENNVYYLEVTAETQTKTFNILDENQVTVKTTVDMSAMNAVAEGSEPTLAFKAYAIQSANLTVTEIEDIWDLANG